MKRMSILLICAAMLLGILSGCSATGYVDDGRGYSNVSTTDDGRVNGTNPSMTDSGVVNGTGRTTTANGTSRGVTGYDGASAGVRVGTNAK